MISFEQAVLVLKGSGLRMTQARKQILRRIVDQGYCFSLDDVEKDLGFDKVTVYRVLQVCEELGLVQKLQTMSAYVVLPSVVVGGKWKIYIDQEQQRVLIVLLSDVEVNLLFGEVGGVEKFCCEIQCHFGEKDLDIDNRVDSVTKSSEMNASVDEVAVLGSVGSISGYIEDKELRKEEEIRKKKGLHKKLRSF